MHGTHSINDTISYMYDTRWNRDGAIDSGEKRQVEWVGRPQVLVNYTHKTSGGNHNYPVVLGLHWSDILYYILHWVWLYKTRA